jgi:hypothetical protein
MVNVQSPSPRPSSIRWARVDSSTALGVFWTRQVFTSRSLFEAAILCPLPAVIRRPSPFGPQSSRPPALPSSDFGFGARNSGFGIKFRLSQFRTLRQRFAEHLPGETLDASSQRLPLTRF